MVGSGDSLIDFHSKQIVRNLTNNKRRFSVCQAYGHNEFAGNAQGDGQTDVIHQGSYYAGDYTLQEFMDYDFRIVSRSIR
ncbi:hypothetical protein SDC9_71674 [bioreactor metagenome]|uniref:Uncharacterized protein n=1 Tax=bioreactor metagenome TaxID=1076179 RepID=A0A644YGF0_9ZZZZ